MDGVDPACAALHGDLRHPGIAVADLRRLRRHVLERRTLVEGGGHPRALPRYPRYYGLIRLLLSLSLFAVLPSSLAELSKHAATFAPRGPLRSALPSPPATSPPGFALRRMRPLLTPKSSRCGGVGFTHTETLTTRK